ncbi:putative Ig domain-containing protein [Pontiella sulfatireligans]|uniref:Alpha-galactosidase n=1 Tax=Pontiella sulfatireligans TaxID=2750658 RepID=A0A6C2UFA9_9BACT|nr:putative Ig domain-containing protein [Pontiella sulfatireligans]VGO18860.1 Alpha-galactosidase A [Pontiella sulfatireligans]
MKIAVRILAGCFVWVACSTALGAEVYSPKVEDGYYILTPAPVPAPEINGPEVFGVRPGSPFLYTIPAIGRRPVGFSVDGLPDGLNVDSDTGIISGTILSEQKKDYIVTLNAKNIFGADEKKLRISVGDEICLTPPMGWNSWNCWGNQVDQEKVLASARAMKEKGLINYGWTYINIDDAWQGARGGSFSAIQGDPAKFPDIKTMCDEVHAMGLKVGIYSSPWITTYAGRIGGSSNNKAGEWSREKHAADRETKRANFVVGEYTFDEQDAKQWAAWGIDYLKYDWNPNDPECTMRMATALKNSGRDIVYSLSNTAPLEYAKLYAKEVNCWRTAGDLKDRWDQDGAHLNVVEQWELHRTWIDEGERGGPGHFPDPDMLVVGNVIENNVGREPRASRLTPDEQYSHISLWSLWSAPLLIGCPIELMDEFTVRLLCNTEVLDIQQDEKAVPGKSVVVEENCEILVKDLANGDLAAGFFNKGPDMREMAIDLKELGFAEKVQIRDVWRQKEIGEYTGSFAANVPPHGVVLVRIKR